METLLREMLASGASDLFLAEGRAPAWRRSGVVELTRHPVTTREQLSALMDRVLRPGQREQFERVGDVDVGRTLPRLGRFRFHFHLQRGAFGLVARAVPSGQLSFEALGMPPVVKRLAELPRGLVLVTGTTGSGKSTTLAAIVHQINSTQSKHIVTLEDPIEFVHDDMQSIITQREVGSDTLDFSAGLRNVLRENPDVIVIGEMRDAESTSVAISAAMTGHLVISTLHTIGATQTVQRILSYFPEHLREQVCMDLSLCLQGVLSQRLVPRAATDGKKEPGRIPAVEVLLGTPAVQRLLRDMRVDEIPDAMVAAEGMETFDAALVKLYQRGLITYEVGAAHATQADDFRLAAQGIERGAAIVTSERELPAAVGAVDMHQLLGIAVKYAASDLHLIAGAPPLFRIHGQLRPLDNAPKLAPAVVRKLLFSLFSQQQRERFDLEHELDFALTVTGGHRFRINAHSQRGTAAVAIRMIPSGAPTFASLGLPPILRELATRTQGLVLVTGPTGSGKSTTLAAMIDSINATRNCHIITIEDPIEFIHQNRLATIEQREIGVDSKSFAAALKYILRQDPDVILVGELRDLETISAALTAAETGHLVLATLHANDAPQTIDRLVDVFPPNQQPQIRVQLSSELLAVVAQRLLLRSDGTGRVAAFEVMVANSAVRRLIRDAKSHQLQSAMETSAGDGMVTLDKSVVDLVRAGFVLPEEGARYMRTPANLGPMQGAALTHEGAGGAAQQGSGAQRGGADRLSRPFGGGR